MANQDPVIDKNDIIQMITENVFKKLFQVGYIYTSTDNKNPGELFGGTWERFGEGRCLVGAGTVMDINNISKTFQPNEESGELSHIVTADEMPNHKHGDGKLTLDDHIGEFSPRGIDGIHAADDATAKDCFYKINTGMQWSYGGTGSKTATVKFGFRASHSGSASLVAEGKNQPHNNIQPYVVVYFWKKIA